MLVQVFNNSDRRPLPNKKLVDIVKSALIDHKVKKATINIIIVNDAEIHLMNKKYLKHDYTTDVITFSLDDKIIDGEIYISADTALKQSVEYKVSLTNELMRLSVHGALHLLGYDDSTTELRANMSQLENKYLQKLLKDK